MKRLIALLVVVALLMATGVSLLADPIHVGGGPRSASSPIHVGGGPRLPSGPIHVGGGPNVLGD